MSWNLITYSLFRSGRDRQTDRQTEGLLSTQRCFLLNNSGSWYVTITYIYICIYTHHLGQNIERRKRDLYEHIQRMKNSRHPQALLHYKPVRQRNMGRPKVKWIDHFSRRRNRSRGLILEDDDDDDNEYVIIRKASS